MGASLRMSSSSKTEVGLNSVNANPVNFSACVWLRWGNDDLIFWTFSVKKWLKEFTVFWRSSLDDGKVKLPSLSRNVSTNL